MNKTRGAKQNDLPSGWRVVRLGDVVDIFDTQRVPITKAKRISGKYPYYGASGITDYINEYVFSGTFLLLSEDGDNLRTRNTPIAFLAKGKFWVNNHAHIVKANEKNLTEYICYALQVANIKSYISGSTRPKITQKDMKKIPFLLPPLPEQKAIAHILGKLDDKIELNRQINKTLETMAQTLFKSWFVDFDPVIDNAIKAGNKIPKPLQRKADKRKTTKSTLPKDLQSLFPNSFVFNNTLKKWIPQGWEVNKIGDLAEYISKGTTPTKTDIKDKESTIYFLKVRNISNDGNISDKLDLIPKEIHYKQLKRSILKEDDILFSIAGTIGRVAIVPHKLDGSNCNQAIAFIRLKNIKKYKILIHQWLISKISQNTISSKIVQAVQANVSLGTISELEIISPNLKVLSVWNIKLIDIYKKIDSNKEQIKTLTKLRDNLLPKLISGKIRVSEEH